MHIFLVVLILIAAIMLIGVVLLQNPKGGGGLTSGIASLGTVQNLGVRRTGDFLSKATAILAGIIMVLAFVVQFTHPSRQTGNGGSILQKEAPIIPSPGEVPAPVKAPADAPAPAAPEELSK
ncbi:preprotein translocase subunit SecG [Prosthecochloris sp. GSB1]|uniref:preprotein translocase subunit SecG n=1 Tax=Prosthecochloris sp. GSB1 TaxID=281093 RepID=UPI000B8CA07F|nr:preprotein translocase subunit SecG [Prosthecochloris sp. GSB1]ASQ90741.1 preprotein translocase subunit SecG [Prosthecochloris sp. GSB1]